MGFHQHRVRLGRPVNSSGQAQMTPDLTRHGRLCEHQWRFFVAHLWYVSVLAEARAKDPSEERDPTGLRDGPPSNIVEDPSSRLTPPDSTIDTRRTTDSACKERSVTEAPVSTVLLSQRSSFTFLRFRRGH